MRQFRPADKGNYILNGDESYVEIDVGSQLNLGLRKVSLNFATLEKNGLIFLGMRPPSPFEMEDGSSKFFFDSYDTNFFALQLEDGYLVSLFNYREDEKLNTTFQRHVHKNAGMLADGKLHTILVRAKPTFVRIWVDTDNNGPRIHNVELKGEPRFRVSEAFVGGLPMRGYKPNE